MFRPHCYKHHLLVVWATEVELNTTPLGRFCAPGKFGIHWCIELLDAKTRIPRKAGSGLADVVFARRDIRPTQLAQWAVREPSASISLHKSPWNIAAIGQLRRWSTSFSRVRTEPGTHSGFG